MATHSSILAWKIPWTEEPTVHRVTKSQNTTEVFYTYTNILYLQFRSSFSLTPTEYTSTFWNYLDKPILLMLVLLLA